MSLESREHREKPRKKIRGKKMQLVGRMRQKLELGNHQINPKLLRKQLAKATRAYLEFSVR